MIFSVEQNQSGRNSPIEGTVDPYRVEAVDRAMRLLEALLDRGELTVTEAARMLDVAPSTAHRLLTTMAHRGFVDRGPRRRYLAGPRLVGERVVSASIPSLRRALRPALQGLYDTVGETVHLAILVGAEMQFVDGIEGVQALRIGLRIGARIPAYCTSGGKAVLADLEDATVTRIHAGGLLPWPGARTADLDGLRAELARVRRQRFGINREESEPGVVAFGAAVGAWAGRPLAALSVVFPEARCRTHDEAATFDALRAACDAAERALGGVG